MSYIFFFLFFLVTHADYWRTFSQPKRNTFKDNSALLFKRECRGLLFIYLFFYLFIFV